MDIIVAAISFSGDKSDYHPALHTTLDVSIMKQKYSHYSKQENKINTLYSKQAKDLVYAEKQERTILLSCKCG